MRTRKMRLVSALMAVAMMFVMMPVGAFAAGDHTKYEVTVIAADTGDANKSSVQKALERTYSIADGDGTDRFDRFTNLTVITDAGVELNADDFQFMSGVKPSNTATPYPGVDGTEYPYLRQLTDLDLTDAKCENNTFPTKAFYKNTTIKTVIFPATLVDCGLKTFAWASGLTYVGTREGKATDTITFPASVTTIGTSTFYHDDSLNCTLDLPATITHIGSCAFQFTPIKGNITIYATLTFDNSENNEANIYAFGQTNIESLTFAEGVEAIPTEIAYECMNLTKVVLPSTGNVTIAPAAFTRTLNLAKVVIPASVKEIGRGAFQQNAKQGDETSPVVRDIIIMSPETELAYLSFADQKYGSRMYFPNAASIQDKNESNESRWYPSNVVILNMNGGMVDPESTETYKNTGLYIPEREGYKFVGWYTASDTEVTNPTVSNTYTAKWAKLCTVTFADADIDSVQVAEGEQLEKPADPKKDEYKFDYWCDADGKEVTFPLTINANTTLTAKWTPYETKADAEVKVNADPADKTVEITVTVEADPTELNGATATLNFTDANGNDDSANVAEVKVKGHKLDKNADDKYTANIADLMGTNASSVATYAATVNGSATLTVTYKTAGTHNIGIVLYANNGDVIWAT